MNKNLLILIFLFFGLKALYSQQIHLSEDSEISIITVGPGNELFEAFGHSAIRITDSTLNLDLVYNYGMFDFDAPNFYANFVKGDMLYKLARYPFHYFEKSNRKDKRWIKAQILNLNLQQKQAYFNFLETNAKPENASYYYDPYFNNCATKLGFIFEEILSQKVNLSENYLNENESLRSLMLKEIPWNTWGAFGINLLLGNKLDEMGTAKEYLYLPDYVYLAFKNGTIYVSNQQEDLVKKEETILTFDEKKPQVSFWNPFLVFSILTILVGFISYKDIKKQKRTKLLDFVLFFITGLVGVLIVYLWFFSNHTTAVNNFNLLWCFAPNLFIGFLLLRNQQSKWMKRYIQFLIALLILVPIFWITGIQQFPIASTPLLVLLLIRYLYIQNQLLSSKK